MPPKKVSLLVAQQYQKRRMDQVMAEWLPVVLKQPISKSKVRKLIVAGAVYLNGKRIRIASKELILNARLEVFVDLHKLNEDAKRQDIKFVMTSERILYEDNYILVVNKPPGLPTQPTVDEARNNLFAALKTFLAKRAGLAISDTYLGLHHRLDRDTSGVILFTKLPEANSGVAALFSHHLAEKTYQALVNWDERSEPAESWNVKNYLGRAKGGIGKRKNTSVHSGGDFAHTEFRILKKMEGSLMIEAKPRTGRTHQIRVHLSEAGMPILGDLTYGKKTSLRVNIPRLMLHAVNLTFPHPIYQNRVSVSSSLPEDFRRCLEALQKGLSSF